jgi:hypothetical protein
MVLERLRVAFPHPGKGVMKPITKWHSLLNPLWSRVPSDGNVKQRLAELPTVLVCYSINNYALQAKI